MKCRANALIVHFGQGSTIVHEHVILVLEALDFGAGDTLCHRFVPNIYQVIHFWNGFGCVAHGERVHHKAQAEELDD